MNLFYCMPELTYWANDNDALVPELWAREALRTLGANLVMGALVNRDFSSLVADFGDVVNTSRPADFNARRKTDADNVENQDAVSPNIPVPLDQHIHISFIIKDGEMSKALPNLVERYLEPAAREMAETIDRILTGQVVRLTANEEGRLGEMDSTNAADFVLDANTALDIARAPTQGRNLVLNPRAQKETLKADLFVSTEKRGDAGTALRTASLGTVYGVDSFMDQNIGFVAIGNTDISTGITESAFPAGTTTINTTVTDADLAAAGEYVVFGGEGKPYRIASSTDDTGSVIVLTEGLRGPVANGVSVTVYLAGEVETADAQAAGYAKEITVDTHAANKGPQLGQWVTFGTGGSSHSYSIIEVIFVTTTESTVLLDRPLDTAISGDDLVFYGPAGGFNLAFHRDAIALVVRPLVTVPADTGARSFVASFDDLAMRVTMQYDSIAQGMRVTFDLLCGVAVLDDRLAVALYS